MLAGALIALLAACGSGSDEPAPKEPTTTSSTVPAPTATVPTMPAQASEDSPEGASAFVAHYVDVFNYAAATGDVDELSRLSSPDCDGCQRYIDLYRDTYAAGGYFKGGDWKIGELKVSSENEATYLTTSVLVDRGTYRDDRKSPEQEDPGERTTVSFAAKSVNGSWNLSQLGIGDVE